MTLAGHDVQQIGCSRKISFAFKGSSLSIGISIILDIVEHISVSNHGSDLDVYISICNSLQVRSRDVFKQHCISIWKKDNHKTNQGRWVYFVSHFCKRVFVFNFLVLHRYYYNWLPEVSLFLYKTIFNGAVYFTFNLCWLIFINTVFSVWINSYLHVIVFSTD